MLSLQRILHIFGVLLDPCLVLVNYLIVLPLKGDEKIGVNNVVVRKMWLNMPTLSRITFLHWCWICF